MNIEITNESVLDIDADAVAVGIWNDQPLDGAAKEVDDASGGVISRMLELDEISASRYQSTLLMSLSGVKAPLILVVGLGDKEKEEASFSYRIGGVVTKALGGKARKHVATFVDVPKVNEMVAGAINGCAGQDLFLAEKKLLPIDNFSIQESEATSERAGFSRMCPWLKH